MDGSSRLDAIRTPKVERVLLKQFHHCREYVTGTLCLTDRHLIFIEPTGAQETWLLYHHILGVEKKPLTTKGYPLVIDCKTFQQLNLIIPRESDCLDIMDTIKKFSQPETYRDLYAFQYRPKEWEVVKQSSGWALYDAGSEYSRMGVPNECWTFTNLNEKYEVCDTYSSCLFVPTCAEDNVILGSAKFRSKGRLPVLSYYYPPKKSALCRSSQPLVGLRGRSTEDEQMIQCILDANPTSDVMYMIDTRPKINAMANKAAGKGYESTDHYNNVIYEFYNIHNIHVMRESLQKLVEASCSPKETISGFLTGIENSGWMKHIHLILEASIFSAKALCEEGRSVLVHCSDGWDRTAQTCALTALLIDSHYRTLHGFMILIEKEWLSFGHKFSVSSLPAQYKKKFKHNSFINARVTRPLAMIKRSGHLAGEVRETSPIFTQFLDCVWQVMIQFPTAFQFNEHFLVTLHDHAYSCQFGTFLGNNERERVLHMFSEQTYSLWGYIWAHLDDFINPLYSEAATHEKMLLPNTNIPQLSFWMGLYCRYPLRQHVCEMTEEVTGSLKQQNTCLTEHIKFLQQKIEELTVQVARFEKEDACIVNGELSSSQDSRHSPPCNSVACPTHQVCTCVEERFTGNCNSSQSIDTSGQCSQENRTMKEEQQVEKDGREYNSNQAGKMNTSTSDTSSKQDGTMKGCEYAQVEVEVDRDKTLNGETFSSVGDSQSQEARESAESSNMKTKGRIASLSLNMTTPIKPSVPVSSQCQGAETDSELRGMRKSPTEVMSPRSYSFFKSSLVHVAEMNLPWESMRKTSKCGCGVTFSYSIRKYHCSHCGCVVCSSCGNHQATSPWQSTSKPHRVCTSCFKMMKKLMQEQETDGL